MKLPIKFLLAALLFPLCFISCLKDTQKFNINPVNEITISSDTNTFTLEQFQTLKIEPTLTESMGHDPYTYEWKVFGGVSNISKVLSTDKNLDIIIDIPPDAYSIQYSVTNTSTGLKAFEKYTLNVVGAFYQGWLVSHNLQGKASLGFVRADGEVFVDPASETNKATYPGAALASYYQGGSYKFILFFTTEGAFRFNSNDLFEMGDTKALFGHEKQFSKPLYSLGTIGIDQFVVDPGGLYAGFGDRFYPESILDRFSDRFPGDYELFPYLIGSGAVTYFYDNKFKRFISVSYLSRDYSLASATPTGVFDRANIGKTAIAAGRGLNTTRHHFIMQDDAGRLLYTLSEITPYLVQAVNYSTCPDFDKATTFLPSQLYDQIYYGYENKLYLYNIPANTSQLIYNFPSGYKVKDMQWSASVPVRGIAVGADNGANGEVYFFEVNEFGKFANDTYSEKHTGFGNIAHLNYKAD